MSSMSACCVSAVLLCAATCWGGVIEGGVDISPDGNEIGREGLHNMWFPEGPALTFSEVDLEVVDHSIGGNEVRMFSISVGDIILPATLENYPQLIFLSDIPHGDSYFGFAVRSHNVEPPGPWEQVGWVEFQRGPIGLEVLSSAYSMSGRDLTASPGIVAGLLQVPEPMTCSWLPLAAFLIFVRSPRNRQR